MAEDTAHPVVQVLAPLSTAPPGKPGGILDGLRATLAGAPFAAVGTIVMGLCTVAAPYADVAIGELFKLLSVQLPQMAAEAKTPLRHFALCLLTGAMVQYYRMWQRSHPAPTDSDPPRPPTPTIAEASRAA